MTRLTNRIKPLVALLVLGSGIVSALAGCAFGGSSTPAAPTSTVARGDVVREVGGVGQIVPAGATATVAVSAAQGSTGAPVSSAAPADAVFAGTSGRIARYLVSPGERVSVGQPLAVLGDGRAATAALDQARSDLQAARLELQLKQTTDPARGLPPSAAELMAARFAVTAARRRLGSASQSGTPDVTSARLELRKAEADLAVLRRVATPAAVAAAERSVGVAYLKLAQAGVSATPAEVLAAKQELARAQADLEAIQAGPSPATVDAARLAVTLAQQKLVELPSGALPSEMTQVRLELTKAQGDLAALQRPPASAAVAAARAAVDLAVAKLAIATGPPSPLVLASARGELDKARAELQTARRSADAASMRAGRLAVKLARQKLALARRPTSAARDTARFDLTKALADFATLRRRGGPAGPLDLALARVKVDSAVARVGVAERQVERLTVTAPRTGTVTALLGAPGTPVDVVTPIAVVADLDHLAVDVALSEFDVAQVRRGQVAVVRVDALGGKRFSGTVIFEALTGVQNGGVVTFPVRIGLSRVAGVKPGMNVSVRIIVAKRLGVVRVPLEAVTQDGEEATVTVVDASGAQTVRPVRLGLTDNKIVEIRRGLKPGERVLLAAAGGA